MGVLSGALTSQAGMAADKDYRTYDVLPGFETLRRFLEECRTPDATLRAQSPQR
jgi:hypothetical protein